MSLMSIVALQQPELLISWLSASHSSYTGSQREPTGEKKQTSNSSATPPESNNDSSDPDNDLSQRSEKDLLEDIQSGTVTKKVDALEELYRRFNSYLYSYIQKRDLSNTLTKEDREEVVGDVWVIFFEKVVTFEWRDTSMRAWL
ncbi:MAG: hypothetical protein AAF639_32650, partial [Chloroflexota bacterium]